jgi:tRNA uridine 5-carbamoylmethylation protein Kti12
MSWEPVFYNKKWFEGDNQIVSWVQRYLELFLLSRKHPHWFNEIIEDLHGNFNVPHGKYFFDSDILNVDKDKLQYCIDMIDLAISKLEDINKRTFFNTIKDSIKDSWCDINNDFYNDKWFDDDEGFKINYIQILRNLKEIMEADFSE